MRSLFAWQHGSSKQHLPTVIFKLALTSGELVQLPPVSLNPPSRDDSVRLERKEQGLGKPKVDGYPVPVRPGRDGEKPGRRGCKGGPTVTAVTPTGRPSGAG